MILSNVDGLAGAFSVQGALTLNGEIEIGVAAPPAGLLCRGDLRGCLEWWVYGTMDPSASDPLDVPKPLIHRPFGCGLQCSCVAYCQCSYTSSSCRQHPHAILW